MHGVKRRSVHQGHQKAQSSDVHQTIPNTTHVPAYILHLQRTVGNRVATQLLQTARVPLVHRQTGNNRIDRTLIDGTAQRHQLLNPALPTSDAYTRLHKSFVDYSDLMQRSTTKIAGQDDKEKGEAFSTQVEEQLTEIDKATHNYLDSTKVKKLKSGETEWLRTLVNRDIPETRSAARWVQHNFAAYRDLTYLSSLTAANDSRKTSLMNYVKDTYQSAWAQMPDYQKQLLEANRDTDAGRIAAIRQHGREMMAQHQRPRDVLNYLSQEATNFVRQVVAEYVAVAGLQQSDLAVVATGSFGSGEMFPYSDVDVQLMTSNFGNDEGRRNQMKFILDSIKMRIRVANMQEATGGWKFTGAWDVDQLVQDSYDPESAVQNNPDKSLAGSSSLYATAGGARLAKDLKASYTAEGQGHIAAKAKMDTDLYDKVRQGDWWLRNPSKLDIGSELLDFKERFTRLPKILLNVLALYYGLPQLNSWDRIDELVKREVLSPTAGGSFKKYLNIVSGIRLTYQYFYETEGLETVSPTPGKVPAQPAVYPKGYYTLTNQDRAALKEAQQIQANTLVEAVYLLYEKMNTNQ